MASASLDRFTRSSPVPSFSKSSESSARVCGSFSSGSLCRLGGGLLGRSLFCGSSGFFDYVFDFGGDRLGDDGVLVLKYI